MTQVAAHSPPGAQMNQSEMMRYLNEMIWLPAAFLAANITLQAVDGSSAQATLTDQGRAATATLFFDTEGRLTDFIAKWYQPADANDPDTWSTSITGYGEYEGLRLPVCDKAVYKLPGGELDCIEVTVTGLHYDTGAAPLEGRAQ